MDVPLKQMNKEGEKNNKRGGGKFCDKGVKILNKIKQDPFRKLAKSADFLTKILGEFWKNFVDIAFFLQEFLTIDISFAEKYQLFLQAKANDCNFSRVSIELLVE